MIDIRAYSLQEFIQHYLPRQSPRHGIQATVLHHTYRPDASGYQGLQTIRDIQAYHRQQRGWRDIGANAYVAPDTKIYNARPLHWSNYAHAYIRKGWDHVPPQLRELAEPDRNFLNRHAFGIEIIGNFDIQAITPLPPALDAALDLAAAVHRLYDLPPWRLFLHRDVAYKSCPGHNIRRSWARKQLARRMEETQAIRVQFLGEKTAIPCRACLEDGVTRCDLRTLAEALGYTVLADDLSTSKTVYLHSDS